MPLHFQQAFLALVALVFACGEAAGELNTFSADYSVRDFVQVGKGAMQASETPLSGTFLYDAKNARAVYSSISTDESGRTWRAQSSFVDDTQVSISRLDLELSDARIVARINDAPGIKMPEATAGGRPDQSINDWWSFLGGNLLSVVTGHIVVDNEGHSIEEFLDSAKEVSRTDNLIVYVAGDIRIEVVRDVEFDNRISKLAWSFVKPEAAPSDPSRLISAEFVVDEFRKVGGVWIPMKFRLKESRGSGVVKLPEGLTFGDPALDQQQVPAKTILYEVELSNPKVNISLRDKQFAVDAEDGQLVTNWDAAHIQHVLVNNKIIPKADALAKGLIKSASFKTKSKAKLYLLLGNLILLVLVVAGVLARRHFVKRSSLVVLFAIGMMCSQELSASESSSELHRAQANGPYCGVYSVLAGLNALDIKVSPETALTRRYISSYRGSTSVDLAKLAADYGSRAEIMEGLCLEHLRYSDRPIILHFKSSSELESYDHWVAFLGVEGAAPVIYDPPEQYGRRSWAEVSSRWDGVGIVLSKPSSQSFGMRFGSAVLFAKSVTLVFVAFSLAWFVKYVQELFPRKLSGRLAFASFVVLVAGAMVTVQFYSSVGLASNPKVIGQIARQYFPLNVRELSRDDMVEVVAKASACIVDARWEKDFAKGTIPGALNMPIDSKIPDRNSLLGHIGKSSPVVVFCESRNCGFSDQVAIFLINNGFRSVSIYRGGYRDWVSKQQR